MSRSGVRQASVGGYVTAADPESALFYPSFTGAQRRAVPRSARSVPTRLHPAGVPAKEDDDAAAVAAQRPIIHLELHAYPTIRVQGQRVELPLKGGLALIARLAAERSAVARRRGRLLWPDADAGLGRGRLRRLMHDVNRRLGVDLIAGDADTLWLDAARFELQCDRSDALRIARRALQHGEVSPEEAAPLLGRDAHRLLDGFVLEADGFAEWLDSSRREQAALVARALERLVARWLADERSAAALAAAERLVRIDPLAEAGYAGLIVARARRGDAAGIAAAYFECAESLRHELGVRPSAAFERVHAEAMSQCARAADRSAFVELLRRPTTQARAVAVFA